ncbi:MAG: CBS domain-containing protein [Nitrincola sp.]|nr:CBS domain-containing protein [Nitrincola sp.]
MLVNDVMITQVVTVSPFATLRQALSLMKQHQLKSLVVEKNLRPRCLWFDHLYEHYENSGGRKW